MDMEVLDDSETQRKALLDELASYQPANEREGVMLERTVAFVSQEEGCFERSTAHGHLTASCWIIDASRRSAVMVYHPKHQNWVQPGGHADGDGDLRRVAMREAQEETGLTTLRFASSSIFDLCVYDNPARGAEPAHTHYDVRFLFVADRSEQPILSPESTDVAWIDFKQLADIGVDDSIHALLKKIKTFEMIR